LTKRRAEQSKAEIDKGQYGSRAKAEAGRN
jgi:hypothetical protein